MSLGRVLLSLLMVGALALAACGGGGGGQSITIKGNEYKFDPATVTVKANQAVKITFQNNGTVLHDWTPQNAPSNPANVSISVQPGKSATQEVTFTQAGTYKIICTQPGHADLGMTGQLVVQ